MRVSKVNKINVCIGLELLLCAVTFHTDGDGPAIKVVGNALNKLDVDLRGIERMIETPGPAYLLEINSALPKIHQLFNVIPSSIWEDAESSKLLISLRDTRFKVEADPIEAIKKFARSIRRAYKESDDLEVKNAASNLLLALVLSLIESEARFGTFKSELNAYTEGFPTTTSPFAALVKDRENCAYAWTLRLLRPLDTPHYKPDELEGLGMHIFNQYCRKLLSPSGEKCPTASSVPALRLFLGLAGYKTYSTDPQIFFRSTQRNSTMFDHLLKFWDAYIAHQGLVKHATSCVREPPAELFIGRHIILSRDSSEKTGMTRNGLSYVWRANDKLNEVDDKVVVGQNSSTPLDDSRFERIECLQSLLNVLENLSFWSQPVSGSQRTSLRPWPLTYRKFDKGTETRLIDHQLVTALGEGTCTDFINLMRYVRDRTLNKTLRTRLDKHLSRESQEVCFRDLFKSNRMLLRVADQIKAHKATLKHTLSKSFMTYFLGQKPKHVSITQFIRDQLLEPIFIITRSRLDPPPPIVTHMAEGFNANKVLDDLLEICAAKLNRIRNFKEYENEMKASELVLSLCSDLSYCCFLKEKFPKLKSYLARPVRKEETLETIIAHNKYHVRQQARGNVLNITAALPHDLRFTDNKLDDDLQ